MNKYLQPKKILFGFEIPNSDPLTPVQVATALDCTAEHVRHLIGAKTLPSINTGSRSRRPNHRIPRQALVDFIEERTIGPTDADFSATEGPHNLTLPEGRILRVKEVALFLKCTPEHIYKLISDWDLLATNIAISETTKPTYRIARTSLIQFINARTEGAH